MPEELYFRNAMEAISWAEEYATRPNIDSQLLVYRSKGGGGLSPYELKDLALTITSLVINYDKPKGRLFACVYAKPSPERILSVAETIGHELQVTGEGVTKAHAQLKALAVAIIESYRRKQVYGKGLSQRRIAKHVGIPPRTYRRSWMEIEAECRNIINIWVEQAERGLTPKLSELELLD